MDKSLVVPYNEPMQDFKWKAQMITPTEELLGAPRLRKFATLSSEHGKITQATLRASALGVYSIYINGKLISDDVLSPGWSSYEWRLRYRTYDVTQLVSSINVIGVQLGNGWYRGRLAFTGASQFYGKQLGFIGQLDIEYDDGFIESIVTDETWRASSSDTMTNDLYDGQTIDARQARDNWHEPNYDDGQWVPVQYLPYDLKKLTLAIGPTVKRHEIFRAVQVFTSPSGKTLIDFGQNLVGWVRFSISGSSGSVITVRYAEVLENGELSTRPLRTAQATDRFILSGGNDTFEPTLTFHGFRYIEVSGWPGKLKKSSLEAVVVHSDLKRTGYFSCSNTALNQLHHNVLWSMNGNFVGIPSDCPQRDERLGWTGDISVFAPTAVFLYDCQDFLKDWLKDLTAEQIKAGGIVPAVVPDVLKYIPKLKDINFKNPAAIWSDAAVWVPWAIWEAYGDLAILKQQYESMSAHANKVASLLSSDGLWNSGFQFGDWLDPDAPADDPIAAKADPNVVATICAYRTMTLLSRAATVLKKPNEAAHFQELAQHIKTGFIKHYLKSDGVILSDCPTVYALAIFFEILPSEQLKKAGNHLSNLVKQHDYKISTGFAGTPYVTWALSITGHINDAYKLLLQTDCPSWLYPIKMGATTIWERWDSMLPDGSINPGEMTSFNHYALGSIADWMHKVIGGIMPMEPGYSKVLIAPRPGGAITWAKTSLRTPHGTITVEWRISGKHLEVDVLIPKQVKALIKLPGLRKEIEAGKYNFIANI